MSREDLALLLFGAETPVVAVVRAVVADQIFPYKVCRPLVLVTVHVAVTSENYFIVRSGGCESDLVTEWFPERLTVEYTGPCVPLALGKSRSERALCFEFLVIPTAGVGVGRARLLDRYEKYEQDCE